MDLAGVRLKSDGVIHTRFEGRPEASQETDIAGNEEMMVNAHSDVGGDVAVGRFIHRRPVASHRPPAPIRKLGGAKPCIGTFRFPVEAGDAEPHCAFHMIPRICLSPL